MRYLIVVMFVALPAVSNAYCTSDFNAGSSIQELAEMLHCLERSVAPPGSIVPFGGAANSVPDGWLLCDGSVVAEKEHPRLFEAIGTIYGTGPVAGSFRLPDLRGRFVRGVDDPDGPGGSPPAGRDPDAESRSDWAGNLAGGLIGSLQEESVAEHAHVGVGRHSQHDVVDGGTVQDVVTHNDSSQNAKTGNFGGRETRPKNIYLNWIIKR